VLPFLLVEPCNSFHRDVVTLRCSTREHYLLWVGLDQPGHLLHAHRTIQIIPDVLNKYLISLRGYFIILFLKNVLLSSSLCLCVVVRLVVKTFIFPVTAEHFSTPLQLPTETILCQKCTVAVAVVLLINLLHHLTLYTLILIINTTTHV